MDWQQYLYNEDEKPLDRLVEGYSYTSLFRTIGFVGDSLASGEVETVNPEGTHKGYDLFEYSWGQFIARKNGLKGYSFSRGGMTAKEYMETFAEAQGFWDKDKACQAYVIALGVNDLYNQNMELGSLEDVDFEDYRNNKDTFLGNYAAIIAKYKEISPDAKFFLVTFPNTATPQRDEKTFGMINGLYALAERFTNTYVIDLYKYAPVQDPQFQERFWLHWHMSPAGYLLTAQYIDSYIDYIIRHNYNDFKNVAFINTDIQYW